MRVFEEIFDKNIEEIRLNGENSHHVGRVMRKSKGDKIVVCDGEGNDFFCTITDASGGIVCKVESAEKSRCEMPTRVIVFAGLSKGDRFEQLIQKCVELGAYKIIPFYSENCVVKLSKGDNEKKTERYNKIARDAGKQSGRGILPVVEPIISFEKACDMAKSTDLPLFLYECEERYTIKNNLIKAESFECISLISGPEGGFSKREAEYAQSLGLVFTTLGPRILRCETAPLAALAAIGAILEQ